MGSWQALQPANQIDNAVVIVDDVHAASYCNKHVAAVGTAMSIHSALHAHNKESCTTTETQHTPFNACLYEYHCICNQIAPRKRDVCKRGVQPPNNDQYPSVMIKHQIGRPCWLLVALHVA